MQSVSFFLFLGGRASDWLVVITCGQSYSWQMTCANSERLKWAATVLLLTYGMDNSGKETGKDRETVMQ